jgi:hypothetical protein
MNYAYLAEQVVLMLSGGRMTVEGIDTREIENLCREADQDVGRDTYFLNYKAENQRTVGGEWLVNYQIRLTDDTIEGYKEAILPANFLMLPKNRGVVRAKIMGTYVDSTNTLTPYSSQKQAALDAINWELYDSLKGGSVLKFSNPFYYALVAKKLLILPACNAKYDFNTINVTLAVANEATLTEVRGLLIIQKVLPLAQLRKGTKADMITDQNANNSK